MTSPDSTRPDRLLGERLSNTICIPDHEGNISASQNDLPGTDLTLHQMFIIVGGICMALCAIVTILNFLSHLIWRSNLDEQKQLMRIILLPLMYSLFSWCSILIYGIGNYLDPIPKLYEAYVIACFHHLMIQVLHPDQTTRKAFFVQAQRMDKFGKKPKHHDKGSYRWYRMQSMFVHAALFTIAIFTVIEEVLVYTECKTDEPNKLASLIIQVLTILVTILAVISLVRVYARFKSEYQGTRILRRFWTIKGFVFLYLIQSLVIGIIRAAGAVHATKYMSLSDYEYGIFEFMLCVEGFVFSILSLWSLSALPYRTERSSVPVKGVQTRSAADAGVFTYLFYFLFPKEVFVGFWLALKTLLGLCLGAKRFDYTARTGVGWKERQGNGAYELLRHKDEQGDARHSGA